MGGRGASSSSNKSEKATLVEQYRKEGYSAEDAAWAAERTIAAKRYFSDTYGDGTRHGRSEHEVTSPTYERAEARLMKKVDGWLTGVHR